MQIEKAVRRDTLSSWRDYGVSEVLFKGCIYRETTYEGKVSIDFLIPSGITRTIAGLCLRIPQDKVMGCLRELRML